MNFKRPSCEFKQRPPKATEMVERFIDSDSEPECPEIEISYDTKIALLKRSERYKKENYSNFCYFVSLISISFPSLRNEIVFEKKDLKFIKETINRNWGKFFFPEFDEEYLYSCESESDKDYFILRAFEGFYQDASSYILLFDDREKIPVLNVDGRTYEDSIRHFRKYYQDGGWEERLELAMQFLILFPNHKEDVELSEEKIDEILNIFLEMRKNDRWYAFSRCAMYFSILFPERKSQLNLDQEDIDSMMNELEGFRKNNEWLKFCDLARNIKILSAQRAQITADGKIKLTYKPKPLVKPRKPLPERSRV